MLETRHKWFSATNCKACVGSAGSRSGAQTYK